ncbi:hypothetical protein HK102_013963, partial [Quaeritorhiza haematococci]
MNASTPARKYQGITYRTILHLMREYWMSSNCAVDDSMTPQTLGQLQKELGLQ